MTAPQDIVDPERALALAYAPARARPALGALWRLDETLGAIVARTENPAVGQMRLTWWHDALRTLAESAPVDPVLRDLKADGIDGEALLPLIDGWEALLDPLPLSDDALRTHADLRGGTLFEISARALGGSNARDAGRLWALVDLAFRVSDPGTAERALALAPTARGPLPRPLAMLRVLAARDRARGLGRPRRQGSPARVLRALAAGLTGF